MLYEFARYHNRICPRFDREGRLILSPGQTPGEIALDDAVPVERLSCRVRRYGVLSQVVVRDRYQNRTETVENPAFQALGTQTAGGDHAGQESVPGHAGTAAGFSWSAPPRNSCGSRRRSQCCFRSAGDLVRLERSNWGRNGRYRVMEAQVGQDEAGDGPDWSWRPRRDTVRCAICGHPIERRRAGRWKLRQIWAW